MGLYRRDNSSNWQMCFFVNGKRIRMSAKTTSKKVAQRIYDKLRGQIAEGTFSINDKKNMPFNQLCHEYLEKHAKVEKRSYKVDIRICKMLEGYFGSRSIGRITSFDIKGWREWRSGYIVPRKGTKIMNATLNNELTILKVMFNLAVEWGWLNESPCRRVRSLKGVVHRLRILT